MTNKEIPSRPILTLGSASKPDKEIRRKAKITFDKNWIQGASLEELECNFLGAKSNLPIITKQLIIECIGDLAKEPNPSWNTKKTKPLAHAGYKVPGYVLGVPQI